MNERIKQIRKILGLTQQKFADRLGIARGNIAAYEVGKNPPSDAVIALICREFNVNEHWLRTGEGEMFLSPDRRTEISRFMNQLLQEDDHSFKNRLVSVLADLNMEEWEFLERRLEQLYIGMGSADAKEPTTEELEAEYIKSRLSSARKEGSAASNTTDGTNGNRATG